MLVVQIYYLEVKYFLFNIYVLDVYGLIWGIVDDMDCWVVNFFFIFN